MFHKGFGVNQDYKEAYKWAKKAADQDDSDAQILLADMYSEGQYIELDFRKAYKWYKKSADSGNDVAQFEMV